MSVRRLTIAFAMLAVAVGIGASSVLAARSQAQVATIRVSALDSLKFTLSSKSAVHGKVRFIVTNKGNLKHDFKIAGKKTPLLGHNKSFTLIVTLRKGKYKYLCTVAGHAAAGMQGFFVAK